MIVNPQHPRRSVGAPSPTWPAWPVSAFGCETTASGRNKEVIYVSRLLISRRRRMFESFIAVKDTAINSPQNAPLCFRPLSCPPHRLPGKLWRPLSIYEVDENTVNVAAEYRGMERRLVKLDALSSSTLGSRPDAVELWLLSKVNVMVKNTDFEVIQDVKAVTVYKHGTSGQRTSPTASEQQDPWAKCLGRGRGSWQRVACPLLWDS